MDMTQNTVSLQETQKWYLEYLGGHLPDLAPTTPLAKADTKIQTQNIHQVKDMSHLLQQLTLYLATIIQHQHNPYGLK